MPTIKLKNVTTVTLHGKRSGETFSVQADAEGVPLDLLWRKRLRDRSVVCVDDAAPAAAAAPAAPVDEPVRPARRARLETAPDAPAEKE